jgi:integrase
VSDPKSRRAKGTGGFSQHPSGDGRWRAYKTFGGKRVYTKWHRTKQLAARAQEALTAPVRASETVVVAHTVGTAIDSFLKYGSHEVRTLDGYRQSARLYLDGLLGIECRELLPQVIAEHFRELHSRGLSQSTMRQAKAVLSGGMKWAVSNGWTLQNYATAVTLPNAKRMQIDPVTEEELAALICEVRGHRYEARYLLAIRIGLRPGEARGLRWRDIDFVGERIYIRGQLQRVDVDVDGTLLGTIYKTSPKSKAGVRNFNPGSYIMKLLHEWREMQRTERASHSLTPHQLTMRAEQAKRIQRAKDLGVINRRESVEPLPDDLVFTQPNSDPLLERLDSTLWKRLCEKAFAGHPRLYAARHTAIHTLILATGDVLAVSVLAGHDDGDFTRRAYGGSLDQLTDTLHLQFPENQ